MRKLIFFINICLLTIMLSGCSQNLENMTIQESDDYISIVWESRTYVPFCGLSNNERGSQIGMVDGDKNNQVYEYKGHSTEDWIISFYKSGEMDNSMLIKEINVTDIPDYLQSDYDWNNR